MFAMTRFLYVEVQSFPYILLLPGREMCFVIPDDFFIKRFVKLSGCHCTCDLSESSYFMFNIVVLRNKLTERLQLYF